MRADPDSLILKKYKQYLEYPTLSESQLLSGIEDSIFSLHQLELEGKRLEEKEKEAKVAYDELYVVRDRIGTESVWYIPAYIREQEIEDPAEIRRIMFGQDCSYSNEQATLVHCRIRDPTYMDNNL